MISILMNCLIRETTVTVYLITKDHFGAVLQEINEGAYPGRMQSIDQDHARRELQL